MTESLEQRKGNQACRILEELELDCWLIWVRETDQICDPSLQFVYDGAFVWQTAVLLTRGGERILIAGTPDTIGLEPGAFDRVEPYDKAIAPTLRRVLDELAPTTIAIDVSASDVAADGMTVGMRSVLDGILEGTPYAKRLVSAERVVRALRGRKLAEEVERIQIAIRWTERLLEEQIARLRVGESEKEIQRRFHNALERHGLGHAWAADHNPAVDAGPTKEFGHGRPSDRRTQAGQLLHFDFGVKTGGYCADLQRMVFFGARTAIPREVQHAFDAVLGAIDAAASVLRPGAVGHEVDGKARAHVVSLGYDEYLHALGHQVGRNAHDGGLVLGPRWERYGRSVEGRVEAGNVFTLELNVRTASYGQVSLEEDILVTDTGCRFLSSPQRSLLCVEGRESA